MKSQRIFIALMVMLVWTGISHTALAQEWSSAQKAVWQNVEDYWKPFAAGDAAGMLSYFHADYQGWNFDDPLPNSKADTEKGLTHFLKNNSIVMFSIKPVGINVQKDFAIVHYYFDMTIKNAEGKERNSSGRWTDILMKQGDKWLLIGDSGGNSSN